MVLLHEGQRLFGKLNLFVYNHTGCQSKPSYHFFQTHIEKMVSSLWILTWTNVFHRLDDGSACVYHDGC